MDEGATLLQIPDQTSDLAKTLSEHTHKQPSILVVDDEAAICEVIEKFLQNFGYRIFAFTNPFEALEFLEKEPIDVVLTDLQMGDVSGVDILRKAHQCQPDAVVILITGYPTVENAVQVLKEGAYDYITKPFRLDELGKVVQRGLEKQRLSREVVILRETLSLYRISEAMNSSLELPQVLQMILNSAITEAQCDNGCIILSSENEERLVIGASRGILPAGFEFLHQLPASEVRNWVAFHEELQKPLQFGGALDVSRKIRDFQFESPEGQLLNLYANGGGTSVCLPLRARDRVVGVLYLSRSGGGRAYESRSLKGLSILANSAARAIENAQLYNNLHMDYLNVIRALANAVEAKDPYTRGHSDRVVRYTQTIGSVFKLPVSDMEKLEVASILHDIGKIGISDQILLKPGKLTDDEYCLMKQHPIIGDRILQPIDSLKEVRTWVYQHHERHDGLGYPEGIQGNQVEFQAKILIVAEVFDALATERAYKKAWPIPTVISFLNDNAGSHFDPEVIKVFTEILREQGEEFARFGQQGQFKIFSPNELVHFFKDQS